MTRSDSGGMGLKEKGERLKYMFDALNKQKKKYDRLKNTRGLSRAEYDQYAEVTVKLSNFMEKCRNFIRPRKNGVGKFSVEDYVSWHQEAEPESDTRGQGPATSGSIGGTPMKQTDSSSFYGPNQQDTRGMQSERMEEETDSGPPRSSSDTCSIDRLIDKSVGLPSIQDAFNIDSVEPRSPQMFDHNKQQPYEQREQPQYYGAAHPNHGDQPAAETARQPRAPEDTTKQTGGHSHSHKVAVPEAASSMAMSPYQFPSPMQAPPNRQAFAQPYHQEQEKQLRAAASQQFRMNSDAFFPPGEASRPPQHGPYAPGTGALYYGSPDMTRRQAFSDGAASPDSTPYSTPYSAAYSTPYPGGYATQNYFNSSMSFSTPAMNYTGGAPAPRGTGAVDTRGPAHQMGGACAPRMGSRQAMSPRMSPQMGGRMGDRMGDRVGGQFYGGREITSPGFGAPRPLSPEYAIPRGSAEIPSPRPVMGFAGGPLPVTGPVYVAPRSAHPVGRAPDMMAHRMGAPHPGHALGPPQEAIRSPVVSPSFGYRYNGSMSPRMQERGYRNMPGIQGLAPSHPPPFQQHRAADGLYPFDPMPQQAPPGYDRVAIPRPPDYHGPRQPIAEGAPPSFGRVDPQDPLLMMDMFELQGRQFADPSVALGPGHYTSRQPNSAASGSLKGGAARKRKPRKSKETQSGMEESFPVSMDSGSLPRMGSSFTHTAPNSDEFSFSAISSFSRLCDQKSIPDQRPDRQRFFSFDTAARAPYGNGLPNDFSSAPPKYPRQPKFYHHPDGALAAPSATDFLQHPVSSTFPYTSPGMTDRMTDRPADPLFIERLSCPADHQPNRPPFYPTSSLSLKKVYSRPALRELRRGDIKDIVKNVQVKQEAKDFLFIHIDALLHKVVTLACELASSRPKRQLAMADLRAVFDSLAKTNEPLRAAVSEAAGTAAFPGGTPGLPPDTACDYTEHSKMLDLIESDKNA